MDFKFKVGDIVELISSPCDLNEHEVKLPPFGMIIGAEGEVVMVSDTSFVYWRHGPKSGERVSAPYRVKWPKSSGGWWTSEECMQLKGAKSSPTAPSKQAWEELAEKLYDIEHGTVLGYSNTQIAEMKEELRKQKRSLGLELM